MKSSISPTPLAAALFAVFAAPAVLAQSAPADATLPEVKVRDQAIGPDYAPAKASIGKTEAVLRDIPQAATVINRAVLDAQNAASLTQALRNVPGITISAGEGGAIGDNINLRGFSARTDIYIDGFRDRSQYSRDTFALDAVEVLKGPASMLFGRGSTGGVINQVSKKPSLKPRSEVTASIGTDSYYRTTLDLNRQLSETAAFRVAAFGQDVKSTRDVVHDRDWGIAPSVRFGIGTPTEITVSALVQRNRDLPDYGFPVITTNGVGSVRKPIDAPANKFYGYTDDYFNQSVNVLNAVVQHKLTPDLTLRNQTSFSHSTIEAQPSPLSSNSIRRVGEPRASATNPASFRDPLENLLAPREDRNRHLRDKSLFNQTDLVAKIKAGDVVHTVTTGLEIGRDEYHEDRYIWNTATADREINLGNPVNGTRKGSRALTRTVETTADTVAVYVNDQIDLNKQWKLVGGLRWDRFEVETALQKHPLPAGFPADTTAAVAPKTDTMLTPRAGVLYQPNDTQSFYVSYGASFNPSAETVTQSSNTAALDPEKNRSYEAGAKLDLLGGNLTVNGAVFRIEKTNARMRDGLGSVQVLGGKIRVDGFELNVAGRITPEWQVFGGYTFLDGKVAKSPEIGTGVDTGIRAEGKTYWNTPRHTATLWSTYRVAPEWEIGGGVLHSSKRYLNIYETALVDGFTRFDATLAYLQKAYDVRLSLQNLGDKKYFETASAGRATPVKGRSATVTLKYRF
ncbi:MAG TPA: TonB-dependent siderophore receptor [Paucimonas sp.]|nr:TonB-dependent siderophore receptor [Paucimonas sp.]